jgi:YVTN family beta-propeller protein
MSLRSSIFSFLFLWCITCTLFTFALEEIETIPLSETPTQTLFYNYRLYIAHKENKTITVINTLDNTITTTVSVTEKPTGLIVANQDVYVLHGETKYVSVLDTADNKIIKKITVGQLPASAVTSGIMLYVVNKESNNISVIDTTTNLVYSTVKIDDDYGSPSFLALAGNEIFILHTQSSKVTIFEKNTYTTRKVIPVPWSPQKAIFSGNRLYILHEGNSAVSIVDTSGDKVIWVVSLESPGVSLSLVNKKLYIYHAEQAFISVVDTTQNRLTKTIPMPLWSISAAVAGTNLYINNPKNNTVTLLDTLTDEIKKTISVPDGPTSSLISGTKIYLNNTKKSLSILYTDSPQLLGMASQSANGVYWITEKIDIRAIFDQPLAPGSTMTVLLNNDATVTLDTIDGKMLFGAYAVQKNSVSNKDLSIKSIASAKIIGISWLEKTVYVIWVWRNLWDYKNIVIDTSKTVTLQPEKEKLPPLGVAPLLCPENRLYRLCPLEKAPENSLGYRENLVCENIITQAESKKKEKRISRFETLKIGVNMLHLQRASRVDYDNVYTDITLTRENTDMIEIIQTGLQNKLITPTYQTFEPKKNISRIEAYALLMRSVCMEPEKTESPARSIHQKAYQEGITTKSWARFRPNSMITRSEVYILASQLADWADKNGGCDRLVCRK